MNTVHRAFTLHLADTDAFSDPACVVPDIGGPPNGYYYIEPRARWADSFEEWLHYDLDEDMIMSDDEEGVVEEEVRGNAQESASAVSGGDDSD